MSLCLFSLKSSSPRGIFWDLALACSLCWCGMWLVTKLCSSVNSVMYWHRTRSTNTLNSDLKCLISSDDSKKLLGSMWDIEHLGAWSDRDVSVTRSLVATKLNQCTDLFCLDKVICFVCIWRSRLSPITWYGCTCWLSPVDWSSWFCSLSSTVSFHFWRSLSLSAAISATLISVLLCDIQSPILFNLV